MEKERFEVIILGTGPAGLQAAIHAARAKVSVLVMGRKHKSSLFKAHVENYCCLKGVSGQEILEQGMQQVLDSGASFLAEDVIKTSQEEDWIVITTENNRVLKTRSLILALGVTRNKLGVPGEKRLLSKGVSYCVDCDGGFFRGEKVVVVGNASAAVSGALTLLFYADQVHLVGGRLEASEQMAHQVMESDIIYHEGKKIRKIIGDDKVEGVLMDSGQVLDVTGVFIEQGAKGAVELAATMGVALDEEKFQFIVTDKQQQTNIPGIFAAGDICGPPWQMAKAVGEGCVAGLAAAKYAKKLR